MHSYPTPPEMARIEWVNEGFLKLHPGPPVHYFTKCEDEFYHTHPWWFETNIILGGYREEVLVQDDNGRWLVKTFDRLPGTSHQLRACTPHKLICLLDGPCMTRCEYGPPGLEVSFCRFDENGTLLHRLWDQSDWHPYSAPTP